MREMDQGREARQGTNHARVVAALRPHLTGADEPPMKRSYLLLPAVLTLGLAGCGSSSHSSSSTLGQQRLRR